MEEEKVKRKVKDSVFTNLFGERKYLMQLYQALHPEDEDVTEEELADITIRNVLTNGIYNDLGFLVRERLVVLVEAQSSWTVNIIIRGMMYLMQTYHNYIRCEMPPTFIIGKWQICISGSSISHLIYAPRGCATIL